MMNKKIGFLLLFPLLANAAGNFVNMLTGTESPAYMSPLADGGKCLRYQNVTILTKPDDDSAGEQILVKKGDDPACKWDVKNNWLVDSGQANFFSGKWKNLIFIDRGTGPSGRSMLVFNSTTRYEIYEADYAEPIEIKGGKLQYWKDTYTLATKTNCDQFTKAQSTGLTPQIQQFVAVDLSKPNPFAIAQKDMRCSLVQ